MKTIYLIRTGKNADNSQAWRELTGKEFYRLIHSGGAGKRRFIEIGSEFGDEDRIVIEATEAQLSDWAKDRNRTAYLKRWQAKRKYRVIPLSDFFDGGEYISEEQLADPDVNVEAEVLGAICQDDLRNAIQRLPEAERFLIEEMLRCRMEISIRELSRELGLPYSTVRGRVNKAMAHLKKILQEV